MSEFPEKKRLYDGADDHQKSNEEHSEFASSLPDIPDAKPDAKPDIVQSLSGEADATHGQEPRSTGRPLYDTERLHTYMPSSYSERIRIFPHARFAYISVVVVFIAYQLVGAVLFMSGSRTGNSSLPAIMQGIGQLLFMFIPVIILTRYTPLSVEGVFRLRGSVTALQWFLGFLGILAIQLFASGMSIVQEHILPYPLQNMLHDFEKNFENIYRELLGGNSPWSVLRALLVGALIPALAEESLFRGLLQRSLEEVRTPLRAMLITGCIFGIIHFNPGAFIPLTIIGVYLGFTAYYTQSLALPVVLHFFNNTIAIVGMYAVDFRLAQSSSTMSLGQGIIVLLVGALMITTILVLFISKTPQIEPENLFEE
jgi:membrane protease YdiL (CAAX protease family)